MDNYTLLGYMKRHNSTLRAKVMREIKDKTYPIMAILVILASFYLSIVIIRALTN